MTALKDTETGRGTEKVFKIKTPLLCILTGRKGWGGGSCPTIGPECAYTLLLSLAHSREGNLTPRSQPSPSNLWQSKSPHPAAPVTAPQLSSTLYHAGSGAPQFPLSKLLQGCQLLLTKEKCSGLNSRNSKRSQRVSGSTSRASRLSDPHYLKCTNSFLSLLKTWPSYFMFMLPKRLFVDLTEHFSWGSAEFMYQHILYYIKFSRAMSEIRNEENKLFS